MLLAILMNEYVCATCDPVAHYYARAIRVFGGINFGDVENSPIRQIKIPTKVSSYPVSLTKLCVSILLLKHVDVVLLQNVFSHVPCDRLRLTGG